jgi:hypothetical protein
VKDVFGDVVVVDTTTDSATVIDDVVAIKYYSNVKVALTYPCSMVGYDGGKNDNESSPSTTRSVTWFIDRVAMTGGSGGSSSN